MYRICLFRGSTWLLAFLKGVDKFCSFLDDGFENEDEDAAALILCSKCKKQSHSVIECSKCLQGFHVDGEGS